VDAAFIQLAAAGGRDHTGYDDRNHRQEHPKKDDSVAYGFGASCHSYIRQVVIL
jgi:hypothetical protein